VKLPAYQAADYGLIPRLTCVGPIRPSNFACVVDVTRADWGWGRRAAPRPSPHAQNEATHRQQERTIVSYRPPEQHPMASAA